MHGLVAGRDHDVNMELFAIAKQFLENGSTPSPPKATPTLLHPPTYHPSSEKKLLRFAIANRVYLNIMEKMMLL